MRIRPVDLPNLPLEGTSVETAAGQRLRIRIICMRGMDFRQLDDHDQHVCVCPDHRIGISQLIN